MGTEQFQLAIISAGVLINLPMVAYLLTLMWKIDNRVVRIETTLKIDQQNQNDQRNR